MKYNLNINEMPIMMRLAEMERDRYVSTGDYSATSIITPPRIVRLQKRYAKDTPLDPSSQTAGMMGTAMHEYFEKYLEMWMVQHNDKCMVLEEELHYDMMDRRITGRYDIREGKDLYDLKTIKCWKLIFDPTFKEFHEQQNIYAYLYNKLHNKDLDSLNIIAYYKDWVEGNALRDKHYPQAPVIEYELEFWNYNITEQFIEDKLSQHIACEELADEDLPVCSREERWERHQGGETVHYAILKNPKAKRATKVVKGGTLEKAIGIANTMKGMTKDSLIEVRYALPKRCVGYCDINTHCDWYGQWCKKNKAGKVNDYVNFKV